jgi:hypothetical protein
MIMLILYNFWNQLLFFSNQVNKNEVITKTKIEMIKQYLEEQVINLVWYNNAKETHLIIFLSYVCNSTIIVSRFFHLLASSLALTR